MDPVASFLPDMPSSKGSLNDYGAALCECLLGTISDSLSLTVETSSV
jgi:hypothetical protein